jgi:hypothetical protein
MYRRCITSRSNGRWGGVNGIKLNKEIKNKINSILSSYEAIEFKGNEEQIKNNKFKLFIKNIREKYPNQNNKSIESIMVYASEKLGKPYKPI